MPFSVRNKLQIKKHLQKVLLWKLSEVGHRIVSNHLIPPKLMLHYPVCYHYHVQQNVCDWTAGSAINSEKRRAAIILSVELNASSIESSHALHMLSLVWYHFKTIFRNSLHLKLSVFCLLLIISSINTKRVYTGAPYSMKLIDWEFSLVCPLQSRAVVSQLI